MVLLINQQFTKGSYKITKKKI